MVYVYIERLSSLGYEDEKAWSTFNRDIFLIIVKWRKWGKSFHDYQKYVPVKYATLNKPRKPYPKLDTSCIDDTKGFLAFLYFRLLKYLPLCKTEFRYTNTCNKKKEHYHYI